MKIKTKTYVIGKNGTLKYIKKETITISDSTLSLQ